MTENAGHKEIPPLVMDVIRVIVSSMRATRLYPENNPIHLQAIQRCADTLDRHLQSEAELSLGVQKTDFSYQRLPAGRDSHLYRGVARDLFTKGIREITFKRGVTKTELRQFFALLATPAEDLKRQNTVKALIWEKGIDHIAVTEAGLGEVLVTDTDHGAVSRERDAEGMTLEEIRKHVAGKAVDLYGRKVLLTDIVADPFRFGSIMLEIAQKAADSPSIQENRLFDLYRDVGRQILHTSFTERRPLFESLAESILGMEPHYRDRLVSGKLYHAHDAETVRAHDGDAAEHLPDNLHELISSRFSGAWTIPQVSALLEQSAKAQFEPAAAVPERTQLPESLHVLAREMAEYTPEEMESLRAFAGYTAESAVMEAVVRTLIYVLPQVRNPFASGAEEKYLNFFSGAVTQLEEMLHLLLRKKDYRMALLVLRSFRLTVDPLFQPRLSDAIKRASDRNTITRLLDEVRVMRKDSDEYQAVSSYLTLLDSDVTPLLLEALAAEQDRSLRNLLMRVLRELGKNQLALIGERLSDERWYFVRNIVTILGESRKEEVVGYLERVSGHKNFQIRQEVVRALLTIRGERAVRLLTRFLNDRDIDIRFMAIRGLGTYLGSGTREEEALIGFLKRRWSRKPSLELRVEAITSLGKVGGAAARACLRRFTAIRWWAARKAREALKAAAEKAIEEIERRGAHAGKAK